MGKYLQDAFIGLMFLCCFTSGSVYGESVVNEWEKVFIQKYTQSLQNQDSALYDSFVISQSEIDSLLQYLQTTVPNCLTDMERNLKQEKLSNQFSQLKHYRTNITKIEIMNSYAIAGCGNVKGMKLNLKCECTDNTTRYRTLTFITLNETNKLLFDIEKN